MTSEATFYDLSLSSDQGLRYSLAAMLIKTHMPACAIPEAAQALFEFIKGDATGAVSMPHFSVAEATIQAEQTADAQSALDGLMASYPSTVRDIVGAQEMLRQEDQSRG